VAEHVVQVRVQYKRVANRRPANNFGNTFQEVIRQMKRLFVFQQDVVNFGGTCGVHLFENLGFTRLDDFHQEGMKHSLLQMFIVVESFKE
jgi:hypothetical protein